MSDFTKGAFWRAAVDRAVRTAAQAALLTIGADLVNVVQVDWAGVAGFAGGGFVLSVLTSLAATPAEVKAGTGG